MPIEDDDTRHRREQAELRAKRKAAKISRPDSNRERTKEYRRKILEKHGGGAAASSNRDGGNPSKFQNLFTQRAEGFQIDFKFRNAPPRPPVGPCFVGHSLDSILVDQCRQYKTFNAVEVNYIWKLHSEPDLGVPLAPSAMDLISYKSPPKSNHYNNKDGESKTNGGSEDYTNAPPLHRDDEALLNWKGSLGDTAAEQLKLRQDRSRAAARAALLEGKSIRGARVGIGGVISHPTTPGSAAATAAAATSSGTKPPTNSGKKKMKYSRVLDETMQSWMKKTTYLSNDYSRNTHTFKSLAQTKQELAQDLEAKQQQINKRRSAQAISASFNEPKKYIHPTKKHLKVKQTFPLLPNVQHWKYPYTHVVMDKPPANVDLYSEQINIDRSFVANVEKLPPANRLTCQLWIPPKKQQQTNSNDKDDKDKNQNDQNSIYQPLQQYDLDVIPLKEEDVPHVNFCFWIDHQQGIAHYVPVSSRVQLSAGRPMERPYRRVARRPLNKEEIQEMEEKIAEIDYDMGQKLGRTIKTATQTNNDDDDDDDDDDDGLNDGGIKAINDDSDDSSDNDSEDDEATFGGATKTIVAD